MDSKQPQVTSGEPAVNISGKLSLHQQVFTLYIIYIYIYIIFIYILTHASTYTTCTLPHQSTVPREQAGPINRGMVRHSSTVRGTNLLPSFWSSRVLALSHEAVTLHACYKKVLSTRLDTRAVFFFFSFSLFQQAERASWANAHSTHTPNADQTSSTAAVVHQIRLPRASTTHKPRHPEPPFLAVRKPPPGKETTKEISRSSL